MTFWERLNPILHIQRLLIGFITLLVVSSFLVAVWATKGLLLIVAWAAWWFGDWIQGLED